MIAIKELNLIQSCFLSNFRNVQICRLKIKFTFIIHSSRNLSIITIHVSATREQQQFFFLHTYVQELRALVLLPAHQRAAATAGLESERSLNLPCARASFQTDVFPVKICQLLPRVQSVRKTISDFFLCVKFQFILGNKSEQKSMSKF